MSERVVLVVDDNPLILDVIGYQLEALGWRVKTARNGAEALEPLKSRPTAVILDAVMPVMGGLETLKWIRTTASTRELPVIMMTGQRDQELVSRAIKLGTDGFLMKPFSAESLNSRLDALVQSGPKPARGSAQATPQNGR